MLELKIHPHRRFNPLKREWVLVSPHRTQRPWQGQVEEAVRENLPDYDPQCYLCPGNERAANAKNPQYSSTFVFDNDFPALLRDTPTDEFRQRGLLLARGEPGVCRVVCFSPRHNLTIPRMAPDELGRVVDVWVEQYIELGSLEFINSVQIFENRGAMMGASNPHPHCQIWASASLPDETEKELSALSHYSTSHGSCLLCDYLSLEAEARERLVCENEQFMAVVPFWAVWPFETLIVGRRHVTGLDELDGAERAALADILKQLTTRYDNLFKTSFPYSMGFHNRPTDGLPHKECHLHAHFYPPLLRSALVRKFMVGFELLGTPQRDITAEAAAARLREVGGRHFLET
jgi:UDPglucose--hexose-1-phosphate uridylyltransferase